MLLRAEHFFLFAGLGPIIEGYIIIAPHRCDDANLPLRSLSDLPPDLLDELSYLRGMVAEFYRESYGQDGAAGHPGISFEHGRAGTCLSEIAGSRHCYHAHLCCYPGTSPVWLGMTNGSDDRFLWNDFSGYNAEELGSIYELQARVGAAPYLYVEHCRVLPDKDVYDPTREQWRRAAVTLDNENAVESQYLRRVLANRVGQPELWDWSRHSRLDAVNRLLRTFHSWLLETDTYHVSWQRGVPHLCFFESVAYSNQKGADRIARVFHNRWQETPLQHRAVGRFLRRLRQRPGQRVSEHGRGEGTRLRVLDAGCGPGFYARMFHHLGIDCVAVDNSTQMLNLARRNLDRDLNDQCGSSTHLYLLQASLPDLGLRPESFDGIWLSAVLLHFPRRQLREILRALRCLLKKDGVLYLSVRTGVGIEVRPEGRLMFLYPTEELEELLTQAGFRAIEAWRDITEQGLFSDHRRKRWKHYLLVKQLPQNEHDELPVRPGTEQEFSFQSAAGTGSSLQMTPTGESSSDLTHVAEELLSTISGPNRLSPLVQDLAQLGRLSMVGALNRMAPMGATPFGVVLTVFGPPDRAGFSRVRGGFCEVAEQYSCPIISCDILPGVDWECMVLALGSVPRECRLHRSAARLGEQLVVLGHLGLSAAAICHNIEAGELVDQAEQCLTEPLLHPVCRIHEGVALSQGRLTQCAVGGSSGLGAALWRIARESKSVDLHIDLSELRSDPVVEEAARRLGMALPAVQLSWAGDLLLCTISKDRWSQLQEIMDELECPLSTIGWVGRGNGAVWYHDSQGSGKLYYDSRTAARSGAYLPQDPVSTVEAMRSWYTQSFMTEEEKK